MNREDIYNIVVPIAISIIGTLGTYFFHNITETKQWKIKRRKSPRDKGIEYLVRVIVLGFLFLLFSVIGCRIYKVINRDSFVGRDRYWDSTLYRAVYLFIHCNEKNKY